MLDNRKNNFVNKAKLRIALLLLLTTIAGAVIVFWMVQRTDREMRDGLLGQTRLVAEAMNIERIKALTGTEADLDTPCIPEAQGAVRRRPRRQPEMPFYLSHGRKIRWDSLLLRGRCPSRT